MEHAAFHDVLRRLQPEADLLAAMRGRRWRRGGARRRAARGARGQGRVASAGERSTAAAGSCCKALGSGRATSMCIVAGSAQGPRAGPLLHQACSGAGAARARRGFKGAARRCQAVPLGQAIRRASTNVQPCAHILRGMSGSLNGSLVHTSAACCSPAGWFCCQGGAMAAAAAPAARAADYAMVPMSVCTLGVRPLAAGWCSSLTHF